MFTRSTVHGDGVATIRSAGYGLDLYLSVSPDGSQGLILDMAGGGGQGALFGGYVAGVGPMVGLSALVQGF